MLRPSSTAGLRRLFQDELSTQLNKGKAFIPSLTQTYQKHTVASRKVSGVASVAVEDVFDTGNIMEDAVTQRKSVVKSFEQIPTPVSANGFIGSVFSTYDAYKKDAFRCPHMYTMRNHEQLGPIYRIKLGDGTPFVSVSDPVDIETVYHNSGKYPKRVQIEAWNEFRRDNNKPFGVLIDDGQNWQKARSALSRRILRPPEIAQFVGSMNEIARDLTEKLKMIRLGSEAGDKSNIIVNLEEELEKWAMESSCKFLYDQRLNLLVGDLKQENEEFFNSIHTITEVAVYLMMFPNSWHKALKTKPYVRTIEAWHNIFKLSKTYVDSKLNDLTKRAVRGEELDDGSFLAFLMIQDKLTLEEIYGNMTELLAASVDTTATTLLWCLHLLSRNPQVQEKLHQEVVRVLPRDENPTREQIDSMPYLKAVVKETLRMFPVTQGTARILPKDTTIRNYNVPAGTAVQAFFFASGNDPEIYENASEFRPERWLDNSKKTTAFASQPFGFGTRMCLGRRLAEQELYLILSQISRQFILHPTKDNISHVCKILITPDQPLELKFVDRK